MTTSPDISNRPRRVLFLAMQLDGGGVTTHMMTLAQGLMAQGVEVGLACRGTLGTHDFGPDWFAAQGVRYFEVPFPIPTDRFRIPLDALKTIRTLHDVVAHFQPDVLHAHCRSATPHARLIEYRHGIPFVVTHHSLSLSTHPLYRLVTCWGRSVICVSQESARYLTHTFGVDSARITIVPHGIDTEHFRPPTEAERQAARAAYGVDEQTFALALIGNLNPKRGDDVLVRKGHDVLLRTLARLRDEAIRPVVLLAGRGDAVPVKALAEACGVRDQIRLLGHQAARQVLWAADAFVLPSNREESFGLVVVEAMCCGVPVVRSATGGHEEQIQHGRTGFVFPPGDDTVLAQHLRRLYTDAAMRAEVAQAGQRFAREHFAQERMADAVRAVYAQALADHH